MSFARFRVCAGLAFRVPRDATGVPKPQNFSAAASLNFHFTATIRAKAETFSKSANIMK